MQIGRVWWLTKVRSLAFPVSNFIPTTKRKDEVILEVTNKQLVMVSKASKCDDPQGFNVCAWKSLLFKHLVKEQ